MKKMMYQLFHVSSRGEDHQTDVGRGFFTSLIEVRKHIDNSVNNDPADYDCYRHRLNPKPGENTFTKVSAKFLL